MSKQKVNAYNAVSRFNHWLIALVVVAMLAIGLYAGEVPREERGYWMGIHMGIGILAWLFIAFRIGWRLKGGFAPHLGSNAALNGVARIVQLLMLTGILVMIVTGPLAVFSGGRDINVFDLFSIPTFMERNESLHHLLEDIHGITGKTLIGLISVHVLGALFHALVSRDGTLRRMWTNTGTGGH